MVEGIVALESVYRDALAGPGAASISGERPPLQLEARDCTRALDACREARHALREHNPNEGLLIEWLLLELPSVGGGTAR